MDTQKRTEHMHTRKSKGWESEAIVGLGNPTGIAGGIIVLDSYRIGLQVETLSSRLLLLSRFLDGFID